MCAKKISILSFLIVFIFGCESKKSIQVVETIDEEQQPFGEWMIGNWAMELEEGVLYESWAKINDSIFTGTSYLIQKKDTIFKEYLTLNIGLDSIVYSTKNSTQKGLEQKEFMGARTENNTIYVSNVLLAFPRNIKYAQLTDSSLMIEISGFIDGENEIQPFEMKRLK